MELQTASKMGQEKCPATDCIQDRASEVPKRGQKAYIRMYFLLEEKKFFSGRIQILNAISNPGLKGQSKTEGGAAQFSTQIKKT